MIWCQIARCYKPTVGYGLVDTRRLLDFSTPVGYLLTAEAPAGSHVWTLS